MARPLKQGIDYFPLDCGFLRDIKIRKIKKACGLSSIPILLCLLSNSYQNDGYFMTWDEEVCFLVADEVGTNEVAVKEVVKKALQVNFFDKDKFDKYNILTSRGILKRFLEAVKRRSNIEISKEFSYPEIVNDYNNLVFVYNNSVNVYKNTQSKVKESKVKESKVKKYILSSKLDRACVEQIVNHLNKKANTHYKSSTTKTKSLIQARFNEGFVLKDFFVVIDKKTKEWLNTDMAKYLRPETLFGTKFESYLNTDNSQSKSITERVIKADIKNSINRYDDEDKMNKILENKIWGNIGGED